MDKNHKKSMSNKCNFNLLMTYYRVETTTVNASRIIRSYNIGLFSKICDKMKYYYYIYKPIRRLVNFANRYRNMMINYKISNNNRSLN